MLFGVYATFLPLSWASDVMSGLATVHWVAVEILSVATDRNFGVAVLPPASRAFATPLPRLISAVPWRTADVCVPPSG